MTEVIDGQAINNKMLRNARERANTSGAAVISDYNLGRCVAVPEYIDGKLNPRGGVYLFPGKGNWFFSDVKIEHLEEVAARIDAEPGTIRTLIEQPGARVYIKQ